MRSFGPFFVIAILGLGLLAVDNSAAAPSQYSEVIHSEGAKSLEEFLPVMATLSNAELEAKKSKLVELINESEPGSLRAAMLREVEEAGVNLTVKVSVAFHAMRQEAEQQQQMNVEGIAVWPNGMSVLKRKTDKSVPIGKAASVHYITLQEGSHPADTLILNACDVIMPNEPNIPAETNRWYDLRVVTASAPARLPTIDEDSEEAIYGTELEQIRTEIGLERPSEITPENTKFLIRLMNKKFGGKMAFILLHFAVQIV